MLQWHVAALLLVGVGLLVLAVLFRAHYGNKYELKTIDLVLIIIPLLFALLINGKIKGINAFGMQIDLAEIFADATIKNISLQVMTKNSPEIDEVVKILAMTAKGGIQDIPKLVKNKIEALVFQLGYGKYKGWAIKRYFETLQASSYLKYLIILDDKGKLFGIYDSLDLAVNFHSNNKLQAYNNFAKWLNEPDESSRSSLAHLPGFIGADKAVGREWSKRDVLKRMDSQRVDSLPVVDQDDFFVGTVERSQLIASVILDVADRLEGKTTASSSGQ